ncbi:MULTISPECIES: glutathione S-transferase N-terminal domain-containing protein [Stenotrophomonas]|jgi:glutathione S-transferase|uniref:Glutathione S-transferase n=2 Tax=Stenotrophomonas TaxID=40323 RepID=A0A4S2CXR2_STEMA|nr:MULTISPECIES: glutathione S-transferase N-terminal domain-containing protein [Stenotrophomonas]MBD3827348.1 glutathione S-transferase N-terminal domain-containing protein [Stenotrophomonas sp.]QIO87121.1 glutathione S-transferase [Stenotrophomonas rhizophila]TGY33361.1 glutathione S-transferase [Stenotrophomonas maltophilia]HBS63309.1 glutathione S-transferase [Stenotrophomonas sp.]
MKLYSKPGACSTADHIALQWTGQPYDVELLTKETLKAPAFLAINPAGSVPAVVDGDFVLTQNAAIMGYIADTHPQAGLAGDGSARQRAEATRWLSFVNSDLHPAFSPLFGPGNYIGDESQYDAIRAAAHKRLRGLFERANTQLEGRQWLAGFRSFADPYFYITLRWAAGAKVDLTGLDNIAAFKQRMDADPGVQAALKAEGLL